MLVSLSLALLQILAGALVINAMIIGLLFWLV